MGEGQQRTHRGAAHEDDDEGPDDAADAHQPGHPEEEDDAEDVLDARQVDAHQSAQLGSLQVGNEGERSQRCFGGPAKSLRKAGTRFFFVHFHSALHHFLPTW